MEDTLHKIIEYGLNKEVDFVDIRVEDYTLNSIELRDGIVHTASSDKTLGASVRVLYKGSLGFASTSKVDYENLKIAIDSALRFAKALVGSSRPVNIYKVSSRHDAVKYPIDLDPRDVDMGVKIGDLRELHKIITVMSSRIKTVTLRYMDMIGKTIYVSSEGRYIEQYTSYTWLYLWVTGREANVMASARHELGTRKGYVLYKKFPHEQIAKIIVNRIENQLKAKTPRGGMFPAILAPEVVGVFTHEAFGHLAEADLTMSGSVLRDKLGKKVASNLVTIMDDPTIPDSFGMFKYDDEGIEAIPVTIVENGVLKQLMTDRMYAGLIGMKPTGNARAEDYSVPPLIRMRTTYIKPGDMSKEELFEDIKFGYYIVGFRGGQANIDGTFQVGVQEAYEIVNGEIGDPVRNMSISGNTLDTLMLIDGVGKDFEIGYGRCGKGQMVFVSDGGPHVRVKKILIGGSL